jgi:hypothetical protein
MKSTAHPPKRKRKTGRTDQRNGRSAKSGHGGILQDDDRYRVVYLPLREVHPSPENDEIYGVIERDDQMENLIDSVRRKGLEEPLLLTADKFILSGHRRFYAVKTLGWDQVPVRIRSDILRAGNTTFHKELIEYNPQRVKRAASLLKEALLRQPSRNTFDALEEHARASLEVDAEFMAVGGRKYVEPISDKRQCFLTAVQNVINELRGYWPLSIRQIHYRLLNNPPLKMQPKRSQFGAEHYRYRNNDESYGALVRLLTSARYHGDVDMFCIDDPTRPQKTYAGFDNLSRFLQQEVDNFLCGFHRDRQQGQTRHIEVFGEKATLKAMIDKACRRYYVPYSLGRGFCSIPVWRDIARRFHDSGRERMTLIIISDYDPEGLELADDAIRSLSQLWQIPVDGHRIAVTPEQIEELGLSDDFNPAKDTSSRFRAFVERTGGPRTWEVESLEPDYLVEQIEAAIEANMDMDVYERVVEQEEQDCEELADIRREIASELRLS